MIIDVHGHLAPYGETGGGPPSLRDPEAAIAAKRELGIGLTVIGSPAGGGSMEPGTGRSAGAQDAGRVRAHNELMGELADRFPDALRAYAYLDPFGGPAMLDQAAELLKDSRFVGLMVNSSVDGEYLGSPRAEEFFALAEETGAPVLVHPPADPVGIGGLRDRGLVEHLVRPCDVTVGVGTVVTGGWLERHPGLRLIAAAGGGSLALLGRKLDLAVAGRDGSGLGRTPPSALLRRVHVETSCPSAHQLAANLSVLGARNVLFGSDAPPVMDGLRPLVDLVSSPVLGERERALVCSGNARRLFGLPADADAAAPRTGPAAGGARAVRAELTMTVRPGAGPEFERAWESVARWTAELPGCLGQALCRVSTDPLVYVITSDWTSEPAFRDFEGSAEQDRVTAPLRGLRESARQEIRPLVGTAAARHTAAPGGAGVPGD
ncbi:hypothetical protein BSZ07_15170 [Streptomyces sp. M1013]|uniref:amidohydrolase family protein n=1 Tax=Streptomyces sp. M1013 TaxID=549798 RepID=UPI000978D5AD|nr:amidohydrolase family protein [Streptomyces sp. M1013]OMI89378.1 hypothetical protein BSZ07_15170 [Streptomyces sp. M1013]